MMSQKVGASQSFFSPPQWEEESSSRPSHLTPHGPLPLFSTLVELFDESLKRKLDVRRKYLIRWFEHWRERVGLDLYPAMRLILPQKDRERATYGFKEITLAKAFIAAFGLNEKSSDAQSLLNWKKPDNRLENKAAGDFPTVLFQTISSRSSVTKGSMTLEELNELLDELSSGFRASAKDHKRKSQIARIFRTFAEKCTPEEIRWIVRIILKDLSIGMKETTVFAVFHPDAMDLFNSCSDLKKICYDLADPNSRLHDKEKTVRLFKPFQPMLCGRSKTLQDAVKMMLVDKDENGFIMEEKLDGERMQLHKRGNEFYYCSRKGKDYTHLYGSNISSGSLTPYITSAFDPKVKDVILDGEMMVWDPSIDKYLPFGNLKTFALDKEPGPDKPRPCFKVFDILYINLVGSQSSTLLTNKTLNVRLDMLQSEKMGLFHPVDGRLEFALQRNGHNGADVESFLQEVVEDRGEGLVLKRRKSPYRLGGRESRWWVKVKPEYIDHMGETVDVLVVSGNFGSGRRGGRVSTLVCALRDDLQSQDGSPTIYRAFVRIGSGLSLEDYDWINAKPWKPMDKSNPPAWLKVSPSGLDDKGDVYLEPEDSFLVKVKAASINVSEQYGCNMTMRFPRSQGIRNDLGVEDCLSLSDMLDMASGKRKNSADEQVPIKKRKTGRRKEMLIGSSHRGADINQVEAETDIFSGMKFHVILSAGLKQPYPKATLEKIIYQNGGTYHQSSKVPGVLVIYGGKVRSPPVAAIIRDDEKDILKPEWIADCVAQGRLIKMSKKYFFHATSSRMEDEDYEGSDTEDEEEVVERSDEEDSGEDEEEKPQDQFSWHKRQKGEPEKMVDLRRLRSIREESETASSGSEDTEDDNASVNVNVEDGSDRPGTPDTESESPGSPVKVVADAEAPEDANVETGTLNEATEYDPDVLFKHLVFYLDTSTNASANGLEVKTSPDIVSLVRKEFQQVERDILQNGGKVTSKLQEPTLTHVVLHKRDLSRRVELMRRTEKPKRRHLVLTTFVKLCLQEETLLDEDGFEP